MPLVLARTKMMHLLRRLIACLAVLVLVALAGWKMHLALQAGAPAMVVAVGQPNVATP